MSINLSVPQNEVVELKPRITVVGVGGAGGNAVNNMINANLEGVEFLVANTDSQALTFSKADRRIQLGASLTQGLGAGSKPEVGRAAAEETIDEINEQIKGSHMVFIAAGMGGGTGSGAAPVIARAARDLGVLTVGVVTKPFQFEGPRRQKIADKCIEELEQYVDTLIVIPNQNLFRVANEKTTFADAFRMADDVLYSGVRSITDLMVMPGLINLDFADVRSVMSEMGKAMMGTGEAEGERRALDAAEAAIANPLLDDTSMAGANGVLINITGGSDMTLFEVDEAANRIRSEVDDDAYIIFGSTFDDALEGQMRVSVVATGINTERTTRLDPTVLSVPDGGAGKSFAPAKPSPESVGHVLNEVAAGASLHESDEVEFEQPDSEQVAQSIVDEALNFGEESSDVSLDEGQHADDLKPKHVESEMKDKADVASEDVPDVQSPASGSQPLAKPAAMPGALNTDAFIPPAPTQDEQVSQSETDALAEAAILNGASGESAGKSPKKTESLFARVTGGAKSKVAAFGPKSSASSVSGSASETPLPGNTFPSAPAASSQNTPSSPATTVMRNQGSADLEPILGGLEPEERLSPSQAEDDLLDIPAFLRRQAN